ncbi:hypothetical protein F5J12DRAFT_725499 [Pisolithus orientalis]|uniref:uncharacterized protein n=1 Tax=Pisolithus orientalis TaxID=936130 RepID=UPI002225AAB4|nr:uncharacterized protein F5J12DRAFT_725499 [Pisolithus orientalis]KAI5996896.1 hypothetical protein F5J12DRAFT_725499 [Pisolithus orientalis]
MTRISTPPPGVPVTPDTLPQPKQTSLAGYHSGDLALGRTAVPNGLGAIPQVPLEYFKSAALPPLRKQIDIGKIKTSLEGAEAWSRHSGWTAIKEPKLSGVSEEETLEPLSKVFDAVVCEAAKDLHTPATLRFVSRPTQSPHSDLPDSSLPDAYLLLLEKKSVDIPGAKKNSAKNSDHDSWYDIAVSFEFKKSDGTAERKYVIWGLHHIMRSDPCRRAAFGVTIENTEMRFWFTCRAVTLVSKSFNFFSEPEHLIHFFCALVFAENHELGWDPTIRRVCVEDETQYIITVETEDGRTIEYQTTKVISDFGVDGVSGRGTRIFKVHLRSRDGKLDAEPVVLKDSWRESDRDREDKILEQIFDDLRKLGTEVEQEARQYFLTVVEAGDVTVHGMIDGTTSLLHGSDLPADCASYALSVDGILKAKPTRSSEGLAQSLPSVPGATKHSKIQHRIHFRLVFKEVCTPIHELQHLGTAFQTLQDVLKGLLTLQLLHSVGWVHRDVSTGNALRAGEVGKLADLEYAKRMNSKASNEVCTGTLDFMACEVEAQKYLFEPPKVLSVADFFKDNKDKDKFPYKFNPLHDMESLWWIATWILYRHVDKVGHQQSEAQRKWFDELFPGRFNARFSAFSADVDYEVLPTSFQPAAFTVVSAMRQALKIAYIASENSMPPAYTDALAELQRVFTSHLADGVKHSKHVELHTPGVKRSYQEDPMFESRDNKHLKVRSFLRSLPKC